MIPSHYRSLSALHEWDDNYNINDIFMIARSIRRFGFNSALRVWRDGIVMAGNHTMKALKLIQAEGAKPELDHAWPPENVLAEDDEWFVPFVDVSHLNDMEAKAFAIADNETARKSTVDEVVLAQYLQDIAEQDEQLFTATSFDPDQLDTLIRGLLDQSEAPDDLDDELDEFIDGVSDGSLLALTSITIEEPRHQVEKGDVWKLGIHVLICADVLTGWSEWIRYLEGEETLFAPYPGPFAALTIKAERMRLVMVQPDTYIAGHILDRYSEIKGAASVHKEA